MSLISLLLLAAAVATPQELCTLLADQGFSGSRQWRAIGEATWGCATARKKLPQGEPAGASDLRYRVVGDQGRARKSILELRMRSPRGAQQVLLRYWRTIEVLLRRLGLSAPPDLRRTVLSAGQGSWRVGEYSLVLSRRFNRGTHYDLWFMVELPPPSQNRK